MNIWDTAGQDKYRSLTANFFRLAKVALLVGDVTSKSSMEYGFAYWLQELRKNIPDVIVFFAANKYDLVEAGLDKAALSKEEIDGLCKANDIIQWEYVSAKSGTNVDRLFNSICITVAADMGLIEDISSCVSLKYKIDIEDSVDDDIEVPTVVLQNLDRVRSVRFPRSNENDGANVGSVVVENDNHGGNSSNKPSQRDPIKNKQANQENQDIVDLTKDITEKSKKNKCC